jgi:phosphoglucan,water dikinase
MAGAGLYDSVLNLPLKDKDAVIGGIKQVWLSLFNERAILSRKKYGIPQERAEMAIVIQSLIPIEYSFVIHTVNPVTISFKCYRFQMIEKKCT